MANCAKYNKSQIGPMTRHYERHKNADGEYQKFGNQDIDTSKSNLNYNLAPARDGGQLEFIKKRCSEVKCQNRDDVNVMVSWVVTAPKTLSSEKHQKFFSEVYMFLNKRYAHGSDINVISAYVHMDENQPHLHYAFIPIVADKKKGHLKVSAKETITKADLQNFHKDLDEYLTTIFSKNIGIINQATKDGNKSIDELKNETKIIESEVREYRELISKTETSLQETLTEVQCLESDKFDLTLELNSLTEEKNEVARKLEDMQYKHESVLETLSEAYWNVESLEERKKRLEGDLKPLREMEISAREITAKNEDGTDRHKVDIPLLAFTKKQINEQMNVKIPKTEYDLLMEQARAYRVNRPRIENLENFKQKLEEKDKQLDVKIAAFILKEKKLDNFAEELIEKNRLLNNPLEKIESLERTKKTLQSENENLRTENSKLRQTLESLKSALRGAWDIVANIAKAIGLLKHTKNTYNQGNLTPKQNKLVDGIADYAAYWAKKDGFTDHAKEIKEKVGLSAGLKKIVEPSRSYEHSL